MVRTLGSFPPPPRPSAAKENSFAICSKPGIFACVKTVVIAASFDTPDSAITSSTADKTPRRADSHSRCCSVEPSATPMVSCPPRTSGEGSPASSPPFSS
ncbi:hypothetical protein [Neisseria sp. P0008.S002]|uniref:hypothetical protein n=1 Tax=Neisseria sp. P0008.S002 TaxID=3436699 RepID=UPI003F817156